MYVVKKTSKYDDHLERDNVDATVAVINRPPQHKFIERTLVETVAKEHLEFYLNSSISSNNTLSYYEGSSLNTVDNNCVECMVKSFPLQKKESYDFSVSIEKDKERIEGSVMVKYSDSGDLIWKASFDKSAQFVKSYIDSSIINI